jgi:hypothetical protein
MEEHDADEALSGNMGGPGPEDWANGAAMLSSALVREAQGLAETAAALKVAGEAPGVPVAEAVGAAALRAVLALAASEAVVSPGPPEARAGRIAGAARRAGVAPTAVGAVLRAAALGFTTDDAAARIAATSVAQTLADLLERDAAG